MFLAFLNRLALAAFSQVADAAQAALVEAVVDAFLEWFKVKNTANAAAANSAYAAWTRSSSASPIWDASKAVAASLIREIGYQTTPTP